MQQLFFVGLVAVFSFFLVLGIVLIKAVFKYIKTKVNRKKTAMKSVTYLKTRMQKAV